MIRCIHVFLKPLRKCSLPSVGHVWSNEVLYTVGSSPGSTFRWMLQSSYRLLGRWAAWSRHTSCLSSWLSTLRRSSTPTSSPSFRLLCRSSFMYSQALDKIPPLLWNRTIKLQPLLKWAGSHRAPERSPVPSWCSRRYSLEWPSTAARSSCWSCPGASAQLSVKHFAHLHCHNSQSSSRCMSALTFVVLGSPLLISGGPWSVLLPRKHVTTKTLSCFS